MDELAFEGLPPGAVGRESERIGGLVEQELSGLRQQKPAICPGIGCARPGSALEGFVHSVFGNRLTALSSQTRASRTSRFPAMTV